MTTLRDKVYTAIERARATRNTGSYAAADAAIPVVIQACIDDLHAQWAYLNDALQGDQGPVVHTILIERMNALSTAEASLRAKMKEAQK